MPVRTDKINIPTVSKSIDEFIRRERSIGRKSVKDHVSVLQGTDRVVGRRAAGSALAKSQYGGVRADKVSAVDFLDWFAGRHDGLAASTTKRGMSSLRGYTKYSISQGYMDERVLAGLADVRVSESPAARAWLYPERLVAITSLLNESEVIDDYDRFAWAVEFALGTRVSETVGLKPKSLDAIAKVVRAVGKGSGDGKEREIPVDDAFIEMWRAHIKRYDIKPNGWMLFWRARRAIGGAVGATEVIVDKSLPATPKMLRTFMKKVARLAEEELDASLVPEFSLTPKVARSTFACTQLVLHEIGQGGLDLYSLKEAMGHTRLDVTERYLADVNSYLNLVRRPTNTLAAANLIVAARRANP
ncbi:MAG TPA: site-specific integrase [Gaiellaceae bacterium]|jgi:site-specific recombinase XerD|nr:site-specific integrase [Gaiellaceae bacterium]